MWKPTKPCFYAGLKIDTFPTPNSQTQNFPVNFSYLRWLENFNIATFGMRCMVTSYRQICLIFSPFLYGTLSLYLDLIESFVRWFYQIPRVNFIIRNYIYFDISESKLKWKPNLKFSLTFNFFTFSPGQQSCLQIRL